MSERARRSPSQNDGLWRSPAALRLADRLWFLPCLLIAIVIYGLTLPRTLTWSHDSADGGDLIAAAATLGVPHPTGYPTYVLLARLFILLLRSGEPAFRVHWLSAAAAAGSCTLLAWTLAFTTEPAAGSRVGTVRLAAIAAALTLAFSPLMWAQAVVAEVYALNSFLLMAIVALLLLWRRHPSITVAIAITLVLGAGIGNHLSLLLLIPAVVVWLVRYGQGLLSLKNSLLLCAAFLLGLCVYLYLPLAASGQPPVNWGDPRTWDRFWWMITGRLYRDAPFGVSLPYLPGRFSAWAGLMLDQFGWWGWLLAFLGLSRLSRSDRALLLTSLYVFLGVSVFAISYDRADSYVYLLPACVMAALWLGMGALELMSAPAILRSQPRRYVRPMILSGVLVLFVMLLPVSQVWSNWRDSDLSRDTEASDFAREAATIVEPDALIVSSGDRATFSLWYQLFALRTRPDVWVVDASLWGYDWYRRTTAHQRPDLLRGLTPPVDVTSLIEQNRLHVPVYVTDDARDVVGDMQILQVGPLWSVQGDG